MDEVYLGDGVYAVFDGYSIVLDLRMQSDHKISLEPSVLVELDRFRKAIKEKYSGDVETTSGR